MTSAIGKRKTGGISRGIVLFEVLISVGILSVACLLLSRAFISTVASLRASSDYYAACLSIESRLWELDHESDAPVSSQSAAEGRLLRQTVEWSWDSGGGRRALALATYASPR